MEQPVVEVRRPVSVRAAGDAGAPCRPAEPIAIGLHPAVEAGLDVHCRDDVDAAGAGRERILRLGAGNEPLVDGIPSVGLEARERIDLGLDEPVLRPGEIRDRPLRRRLLQETSYLFLIMLC